MLLSCESSQDRLEKIKPPIVVVAIGEVGKYCTAPGAIVLKGSDGKLFEFSCHEEVAHAVSTSRQVGDTLQ